MLLHVERNAVPARLMVPFSVEQWRAVRIERTARARAQKEGFESEEIFKASIESKLIRAGCTEKWFTNFQKCGREFFYQLCPNCGNEKQCTYQCSNRICPRCNWRIAMRRRDLLEKLTNGMPDTIQHVVLTQRNFYEDLPGEIKKCRKNLGRLRERKVFGNVIGGCASLEMTNERRGWHMHWHLLLQASPKVDEARLAIAWGKLVGQDYAIVKVKPVKEGSYLQEVCKYAAKPSELVKWKPTEILCFADAIARVRLFTVFGAWAKLRKYAALQVKLDRAEHGKIECTCGCQSVIYGATIQDCQRKLEKGYF